MIMLVVCESDFIAAEYLVGSNLLSSTCTLACLLLPLPLPLPLLLFPLLLSLVGLLIWIMKEFCRSNKDLIGVCAKFFHYPKELD
jgi:hypothetical protein